MSRVMAMYPCAKEAVLKELIVPALYVPTFVWLMEGNGAIKLDATMLALVTLKLSVSNMSTDTDVLGDPGLETETTLKPKVLGRVTPASD